MKKFALVLFAASVVLSLAAASVSAGQLAKLTITPERGDKLVFNFVDGDVPATVDVDNVYLVFDPPGEKDRATPWKHHDIQGLDAPTLEFTSGEPYRMELDLFFDGYEDKKDVRELTDKIEKLALVNQELHRPPTLVAPACLVTWGNKTYACEVETTETKFTEFLGESAAKAATDERIPVRAVMHIIFTEFSSVDKGKNDGPHKRPGNS